jgi:uncharacterized protein YbbK (DUF523 family)/uncharacterized protein YbgA (DUF1722 family)
MPRTKLRVGVSACLLGQEVRYDGRHKRDRFLVEVLAPFVEWVPVCPELELGLGVPREPIRLVGRAGAPRLVGERTGVDHTEAMRAYAEARVAALAREELSGYVTKKDSPSCGLERVRVHSGKGGQPRRAGVGAFVRVLIRAMPLLPVEEEDRLADPALRESFIERVLAYARWKKALAAGMGRGDLVRFHATHQLALLAHSPAAYRRLGALVGGLGKGSIRSAVSAYGEGFMAALRLPATRARQASVLRHALGQLRTVLPEAERRELEEAVSGHARGLVPLAVPRSLIRRLARKHGLDSLADQRYLEPDPLELELQGRARRAQAGSATAPP